MKLLKKLFNILSALVYIIIVMYLLTAAPMLLGYRPVMVLSGSMEPAYHVGSILYYKGTEFEDIKEGDVITFQAGEDTLVTHRDTAKDEADKTFITKGDANDTEDGSPVKYSQVAGVASPRSIPFAGYFIDWGKKPVVIAGMAGVIIISVILDSLFPEKKRKKERTENHEEEQD